MNLQAFNAAHNEQDLVLGALNMIDNMMEISLEMGTYSQDREAYRNGMKKLNDEYLELSEAKSLAIAPRSSLANLI